MCILCVRRALSPRLLSALLLFFFFNHPATTEIYTLSLHDALPIFRRALAELERCVTRGSAAELRAALARRSEEHTSELQSHSDLVCRLLLEKKKKKDHPENKTRRARHNRT